MPRPPNSRTPRSPCSTTRNAAPMSRGASMRCTASCAATPPWPPPMPSKKSSPPRPPKPPRQLGLRFDVQGLVAGVDEAGRGPLAGPVVAAAVILDDKRRIRGLNDSKVLTPEVRARLYDEICAKALCVSIAEASVEEIDRLNILHATMLAMK